MNVSDQNDVARVVKRGEGSAWNLVSKVVSFPVLLAALLVLGVFVTVSAGLHPSVSSGLPVFEGDTWFHILVGEDILATRSFPTADSYSFTAYGNECMAFEWLGQTIMALTDRFGGVRALTALFIASASTLILLLYYWCILHCANVKAAFVACLAVLPLLSSFFTLRPQWFGYILLLILMICLEHFRRGRNWALWIVPILFVIWVNVHGSFVLGLFVLAFYWMAGLVRFEVGGLKAEPWTTRQRLQLELVSLFSVLALMATPYGGRLLGFTLHVLMNASLGMAQINEYLALDGVVLKYVAVLLLVFLAAQVMFRPRYRLEQLGLLVVTTYLGFAHRRIVLFWVLVFTPLLAVLLARWVPQYDRKKDHYLLNAVLMVLVVLGVLEFLPSRPQLELRVANVFPQGAVNFLRHHPVQGRMFNEDFWGAYLIRSLGRQHRVFIDGRSQLFEDAGVFADYGRIVSLDRDTLLLLRKYDVEACLVTPNTPLATYLAGLPDWQLVFTDRVSSLYISKHEMQSGRLSGGR